MKLAFNTLNELVDAIVTKDGGAAYTDELLTWEESDGYRLRDNPEVAVNLVMSEGGGEGGGEHCEAVLKIGDQFFKVYFNYYSYNGYDFDYATVEEVFPREVQRIEYHKDPVQ